MNPLFQALMGSSGLPGRNGGQPAAPAMGGPFGAVQGVMQRARQIAQSFQNPQQMVQQFFPDAPEEMRNDPEQLVGWLQQTGKVNPQMIQMARSMMGGR